MADPVRSYRVALWFRPMGPTLAPFALNVEGLDESNANALVDAVHSGAHSWASSGWAMKSTVMLDGCFAAFLSHGGKG